MKNLPLGYLYDKLPDQVRALDTTGLVERICAAVQDRVGDLRTQISQVSLFWESPESPGKVYDVALVTVKGSRISGSEILTIPIPAPTDLTAWAAEELGIDQSEIASITQTTDLERGAAVATIGFLAETIGARLYPGFYGDDSTYAAAIRSSFFLNAIRGTPDSFRILALLHGFQSATFVPLWGRAMPRDPSNLLGPTNAADYAEFPDVDVDPVRRPNYGVDDFTDGPYYAWTSGWLSPSSSHSQFAPIGIANSSPYVTLVQSGSTVTLPAEGVYYLSGGAPGAMAAADLGCGLAARAVIPGVGFNGLQLQIEHDADGELFRVKCYGNLSRIKYRSSLFDLIASYSYDSYAADARNSSGFAQPSPDLELNPSLLGAQAPTAAAAPYRPWTGGATPQPTVTLWPTISWAAGTGSPTDRHQALPTDLAIDWSNLSKAQAALARSIEDVRPATRYPRSVNVALSLDTAVGYAAYVKSTAVSHSGTGNWYIVGTSYYRPNGVRGEFYVRHNGVRYRVLAAHSPTDDDFVTLETESGPVQFTGDVFLSSGSITIDLAITAAPGSDTWYLEIDWLDNTTETIGTEPGVGVARSYKLYPESGPVSVATAILTDYFEHGTQAYGGALLPDSAGAMALDGVDVTACHTYPTIESESGQALRPVGYIVRQSDTGYLTVEEASVLGPTQRATRLVSATLQSYPVGSVLGNLVACPWLFSNPAHLAGLAGWWTFSEHPDQPYQFVDSTPYRLSPAEAQSGGFYGSYQLADRVWNAQRGWVFGPTTGSATVIKDRGLKDCLSLSIWLAYSQSSASWITALALGQLALQVRNGEARFYNTAAGSAIGQAVGMSSSLRPMRIVLRKLARSDATTELAAVITQDVARSGLPVGVLDGQKVLLTGQDPATENGVYIVNSGPWYRLTAVSGVGEQLELYRHGDRYYVCTNAPVSYGSAAPAYAEVNTAVVGKNLFGTAVSGDAINVAGGTITVDRTAHGLTTGAQVALSGSGQTGIDQIYTVTVTNANRFTLTTTSAYTGALSTATTEVYYEAVSYTLLDWSTFDTLNLTGASGLAFSDLRVWSIAKTLADYAAIERPVLTPDPACVLDVCQTNRGACSLQAMPNGRVFLSGRPVDQANAPKVRVSRYAVTGEYCGHGSAQLVGYGNDNQLPANLALGVSGLGLPATGSVPAGNSSGWNLLVPSFRMVSTTDKIYDVGVTVVRAGASTYTASLSAALSTPVGARPHETAAYYGWPSAAQYPELDSAGSLFTVSNAANATRLQLDDSSTLAFSATSLVGATDSVAYLVPKWVREIDTAVSGIAPGSTSTLAGIPYPARNSAGPIQLAGHAWSLSAGRYKLVLETVAWDALDLDFTGFVVDARISWTDGQGETSSTPVTTARLCPRGRGQFKLYSGTSYSDTLPENATSAQIAAQLARICGTTFNVSGESTRGPYTATTTTNVYKPVPQVQLSEGVTVKVTSVQVGNGSQPTIFRIDIIRPTDFIDIDIPAGLSTSGSWSISLYFTNALKTETTARTLVICRAALYQLSHGLVYSVSVNATVPVLTVVNDSNLATGGFLQSVAEDGTTSYADRSTALAGVDQNNPRYNDRLSAAAVLCGSTMDRVSWIASTRASQANPSAPAVLTQATVTLYADNGTSNPNTPVTTVVTTAA